MPVCCEDAMSFWEITVSISSASEAERGKNFSLLREHTDFHPFTFDGLKETVRELKEKKVPVYFTIDLDCLDPSVFPGTGTPEAGGVSFLGAS